MSIYFNDSTKTFYLENQSITYAFYVRDGGYLTHLYYGRKIDRDDISYTLTGGCNTLFSISSNGTPYEAIAPEITFFGTGDYREPTVHVKNENGDRLTELLFDGYDILKEKPTISGMPSLTGGETLVVHLKDSITLFQADLYYTVYDDADVIARRIVYKNGGDAPVRLDRAYSFMLQLPDREYKVLSLFGAWARERAVQVTDMLNGVITIDSKRTTSSHVLNPFIAVMGKNATEDQGDVYGVSLVYSSSFTLKVQGTHAGDTLVTGGINDFDFEWLLEAGEAFETPEAVIAYSSKGLGDMSRSFHDAFRNHLVNKNFVYKKRPIVINNWEGTAFTFDEQKLKDIVDGVENTTIDTFVLDDGWFGVRNDATSGLGDWDIVNKEKLPCGLKGISDYTHSKGMKFGLWFEPEMVSENSELFRKHPDWAIQAENRGRCHGRNQLVLDITRKDVRDHIVDAVNTVIRENGIDYVKWDSNRFVTESVSLLLPKERQMEFSHRYALGLYDMLDRIVYGNPNVFFEGCSGGGGRFDPAMLYYFPQIWTSDNSDAQERTLIQYGTSMVYPASSMSCHVTASPSHSTARSTSLKTRGDIASMGAFGYELDASTFTDEDRENVKKQIEEYNTWNSDLVLSGDLYRLLDPFTSNYFAYALVSKDKKKAVLTAYRRVFYYNPRTMHVKMTGLDENKRYYVYELDKTLSGRTLMNVGLVPSFPHEDFATFKFHFEER